MKLNLQIVFFILLLFTINANGQQYEFFDKSKPRIPLAKISGSPSYQILNINNITTWQRADGQSNHTPLGGNGCIFPRGTASVIYQDGILWGAKTYLDSSYTVPHLNQVIRVGGATYHVGTRAGRIVGWDSNAVRANENDADVRTYRIRRDYAEFGRVPYNWELFRDASEYFEIPIGNLTHSQIIQILNWYERDWLEWPVQYGAPYIERNGIAGYQPPPPFSVDFTHHDLISGNYDEPGIGGYDHSSPADQVIWTVYNDLDRTATLGLFGSEPLGLEIQVTLWGYKSTLHINNGYFKRVRIINKGGVDIGGGQKGSLWIDSLFIGIWSDIDIGDFADDLIGCDTLRQSAFCYNNNSTDAEFKRFDLTPPAVGYALLYGPLVPGSPTDKGVFDFRSINGKRNLGITSFSPKFSGSSFGDPPFSYEGALRWWKWLRGYLPEPSTNPDRLYPHPPGMLPTKFPFSGDPINRTGFIDGLGTLYSAPAGDRIFTLSTGPVKLAPGESTEIVYAVIGGLANERLASFSILRHYTDITRHLAKIKFALPRPPESPKVRVIELDREIILEWGSDLASVQKIENQVLAEEYEFEGYNIYQLPAANSLKSDATRIATYDLKNNVGWITDKFIDPTFYYVREEVVQRGENTRIKRYISFKQDVLDMNRQLNNGQEYYFAVTSYNYSQSPDALPRAMESEINVLKAKPQIPFGVGLQTKHFDKLLVKHIQGQSEGIISPYVIDPTSGTGDTYEIRFDTINGGVKWNLYNLNSNRQIVTNQRVNGDPDPPIVEGGILLKLDYVDVDTVGLPPQRYYWLDDIYQYTVPAIDSSLEQQKASSRRVNVFPNPYYAGHSHVTSNFQSYVTFNNLPPRAIIRIFNLAGHLVRTLRKSDTSQFVEWNLRTEENLQIASGMYLCYVEMPEIGETKILKLAIIQPEILER
ncbi:MAG: hypothetical protein Q8K98_04570 [Bacteroidota bacterium]|nr:hypothetical protein [Bacteroidota bacterium]